MLYVPGVLRLRRVGPDADQGGPGRPPSGQLPQEVVAEDGLRVAVDVARPEDALRRGVGELDVLELSHVVDEDGDVLALEGSVQERPQLLRLLSVAQNPEIVSDVGAFRSQLLDLPFCVGGVVLALVDDEDVEALFGEFDGVTLADS